MFTTSFRPMWRRSMTACAMRSVTIERFATAEHGARSNDNYDDPIEDGGHRSHA
jgi:hypothetical protein